MNLDDAEQTYLYRCQQGHSNDVRRKVRDRDKYLACSICLKHATRERTAPAIHVLGFSGSRARPERDWMS